MITLFSSTEPSERGGRGILPTPRETLGGVRFCAVLVIALGCLFTLYALLAVLIAGLEIDRFRHGVPQKTSALQLIIAIAFCVTLAFTFFLTGSSLWKARQWAAYVTMTISGVLIEFGAGALLDLFYPNRHGALHGPDDSFGIIVWPPLIAFSLWTCVYLNLPHVRRHLSQADKKSALTL